MVVCGIDVGARNVSAVIFNDNAILAHCVITSGEEGGSIAQRVIMEALAKTSLQFNDIQYIVTTGCGRNSVPFANRQSTEVVCQAKGAYYLFPAARTVINLGAESSRVIKLNSEGRVISFVKNDKCAAGSGLFLETMSQLLATPLELMGELSLISDGCEEVSSICAVFAESEVISHIHRGIPKQHILVGVHKAVVSKVMELLGTAGINKDVVVTGGVAKNPAIVCELEQRIGANIIVPEEPQIVGALGAALIACEALLSSTNSRQ
jgi:predicted CoA-substrate-specific enzyme activase